MKKSLIIWITALILLIGFSTTDLQAQCAMCRASVESNLSSGESTLGSGLNKGILFLLAMPYLAISIIAYLWYRTSIKERSKRLYVATILKEKLNIG
ncbi:hypothetical protein QNI19_06160 [Cytophagaceae bacterium DM2B3-1]|uniref:Uncharacterized protein n=1 Tax=Xanthocytophaga flava TaxID=3048013 RepID=A0ABT7CFI0_9BACT|nr:hypothetical protein [Xanthocytophaga flavus]MDJ1466509.1 hypothetical protein [Xanthocytophaga flavus]MDJ1492506.1 hypothetical protein [Xanthocytophaga flavus]